MRGERLVDGRPIPFSMTEVILSVCAIVQPIGEEKNLPLHVTYPQVDGRIGYPSALNRILLNLTSNALRYTDTGSVSIGCIELNESSVEFWVKDTGHGIPGRGAADAVRRFPPRVRRNSVFQRRPWPGDLSNAARGDGEFAQGGDVAREGDALLVSPGAAGRLKGRRKASF